RDVFEGVTVGLALVEPGERIERRHKQERQYSENQYQQGKVREIGEAHKNVPPLNRIVQRPISSREPNQGHPSLHSDALQDVLVNVMTKFVGQHGLDLIRRVIVEKSVGQNNAPRVTEASERRIRFLTFFRQPPF